MVCRRWGVFKGPRSCCKYCSICHGQITDEASFGRQLNGRLSNYCSLVKRVAANKVEGFYGLLDGEGCAQRVRELLHRSTYIYPTQVVSAIS